MKKILLGCLGVALLTAVLGAGLVLYWLLRERPVLESTLSLPTEVELDATVPMVITTTNGHSTPVTLDSIDVDDSFLAGFQVIRIEPEPEGTLHVPFLNQRSWAFATVVQPGDSLTVTFHLKPVAEGHFSGDIDVCNPSQDFETLLADVVVRRTLSSQAVDREAP
jgi:uncharacterized protein (DUF58 family)